MSSSEEPWTPWLKPSDEQTEIVPPEQAISGLSAVTKALLLRSIASDLTTETPEVVLTWDEIAQARRAYFVFHPDTEGLTIKLLPGEPPPSPVYLEGLRHDDS